MGRHSVAQSGNSARIAGALKVEDETRLKKLRSRFARYGAAASVAWFSLCVTAAAQIGTNPFKAKTGAAFKGAPPPPPDPEAQAKAAEEATNYVLGVHVNTIFFVAAAVIGVLWFTLGGGRKAKVTRH
jgi:hypothetical protein